MSSCDNNASASNLKIKTTNINEEYNNELQENQEKLSKTTATNATIFKNDETLNFTKTYENPILNVVDDVTTIKTIDNATILEKAASAATASSNTMLPQPGDVAAKETQTVVMKTGNVLKIEVAASKVEEAPSLAASTVRVATGTAIIAPLATTAPIIGTAKAIPAAAEATAASAKASAVAFESASTTATFLDDNNATVACRTTEATTNTTTIDQIKSTATKLAALLTLDHQGQNTTSIITSDISAVHAPTAITTLPPAAILATPTTPQTAPASPTITPTVLAASGTHLPHIASEPTFGIILRRNQQQQQQRFRSYHDAKLEGTTSTSSTDENPMTSSSGSGSGSSVIFRPGVSVSASASPSMVRKSSDACMSMSRRVSFPKSDNELVTGYLEPANPWEHACLVKSISEIAELYVMSCQKHNTKPLQTILDHLKVVELNKTLRQPLLSLKSIKLAPSDCEALEEVFKRVQYKAVDLSSCELTETAAMALFEMIEYYEAANELDISSNADGMTHRGWTSCTYMISHSRALQVLNAQGNPISRTGAENLGHALNTSNLHTIKLEHCGLKGAPLYGLCFKLRHNRVLRELWLAHNDLDWYDAENIAKLITANHYLQLLDISNNNIRDEGLIYIVRALITQSREIEKRALFQRAPAIDDDDCGGVEITSGIAENVSISCSSTNGKHKEQDDSTRGSGMMDSDASQSEDTDDEAFESARNRTSTNESKTLLVTTPMFEGIETVCSASTTNTTSFTTTTSSSITTAVETATSGDLDVDEEDTTETMKSTPSATLKNSTQSVGNGGGQSMLDKLLSMNSTDSSSSEDAASNLSTDTLAACNSEDASLISDDIFDGGAATATTTINTSTNSNALTRAEPAPIHTPSINETITTSATMTELERVSGGGGTTAAEATNGESSNTESNSSGNSSATSSTSNNGNNNNNNNSAMHQMHDADIPMKAPSCVFEMTAEENDCLISSSATKALDVNKNTTKLVDDFDDTHSTDSAFESASEGDISRHLPEEFIRLSASFESSRIDEAITASKEFSGVETATIATESTECLVSAVAATPTGTATSPCATPTTEPLMQLAAQARSTTTSMPPTPTSLAAAVVVAAVSPVVIRLDERCDSTASGEVEFSSSLPSVLPKVTISEDTLYLNKVKGLSCIASPSPTPPPPSTSPGGASLGMRRTESSCAFITSSTRNRSQSSDSLCSDTSLDGSLSSDINFSTSTQINEKLAKNDTLTRQQRQFEVPAENSTKAPCGLKALALWNNNLTKDTGLYVAELLAETASLELLNIGKNCLSNDFVSTIKDSLMRNTTLTTLGLQSAHLSAKGIETLSSILTFGGNCTLQRIDIRDNKLEVESLSTLAEVLKSNTTVTQIDIDDEPKRLSVGNDAHLDYARVLENVRSMCSRNEKTQSQLQAADKSVALANVAGRRRGGYYLGSRKISLTCHTRPVVSPDVAVATHNSKLDVKRKTGTRLRSPIPSPPTVSPSSSPSRSRFKVFRVSEVSPLTSPMSTAPSTTSCSVTIPTASASNLQKLQSTSLPTASSLSVMSSVTSSTQSIKRYSVSPRSRFQVSKIYEDPRVPLASRALPPITPPLNAPPTPMMKSAVGTALSYSPPVQRVAEILAEATAKNPSTIVAIVATENTNTCPSANTTATATTEVSHTPNLDSTKETSTNNTTNTNYTQKSTTLSPISSASSASSSSSSSSSTSPASLSSSSSIISATSSSSTSSSITPLFSDSGSGSDNVDKVPAPPVTGARCPIAVFDENDITLTKNSTNNVRSTTAEAVNSSVDAPGSGAVTPQLLPTQPRARKSSWLGNPAAVDKLLTLFHNPGTIFQRSSSPDSNLTTAAAATATAFTAPLEANQQPTEQQKSLVPTRKCSPPAWSKLGNEMMRPVTSALQSTNSGDVNSTATSLANTAEQSISFLDAASKQICDFSKQVFRQNLAFGNETNAVVGAAGSGTSGVISMMPNNGSSGLGSIEQHDAAHIPSNVQLEIKENISPEHTITDETLHSLQKLCLAAGGGGSIAAAASAITFEEHAVFLPEHATEETKEQAMSSNSNILLPTANANTTSTGSSLQQHEEQNQQQHATPQTS